jgi:hypothetical protein
MVVTTLVNYDMLYLGGGNAQRIDFKLPRNVKLVANIYGITGGVHLWKPALDELFTPIGAPDARTAARQLPVRHAVTKR